MQLQKPKQRVIATENEILTEDDPYFAKVAGFGPEATPTTRTAPYPYREALDWIKKHPGTGSAQGLAKLILSLWNTDCSFSFRECADCLDADRKALAIRMASYYSEHGEDRDLVDSGHEVCELFPKLWEMTVAMKSARFDLLSKWRQQEKDLKVKGSL